MRPSSKVVSALNINGKSPGIEERSDMRGKERRESKRRVWKKGISLR